MIRQNAILQARNTPNMKGYEGNHTVHQITIPKKIIKETEWKKGEKITISANGNKAIFESGLPNNADETRKETLDESMSNLDEHKNLPDGLLKIEKKIDNLGLGSSINFILLMIIFLYLLFFGGVLP